MGKKYICKLRRGIKDDKTGRDDWASLTERQDVPKELRIPQDGELVLEDDNGIPRLKIGDGAKSFGDLPYMSIDSFILPTQASVELDPNKWNPVLDENGKEIPNRYYQPVTVKNATTTPNSKIDLQPNPKQLATFAQKDITFTAVNVGGDVRVCIVGEKPKGTYVIDATVTETEVTEAREIIGNTTATPNPRPDWEQTDSAKPDFIKNKPTVLTDGDVITLINNNIPEISKDNLSTGVRDSLDKADTALQSETDPTVPAWAKARVKPTYTADEVGAVSYTAQTLTEDQKAQARFNIGAGASSFSGDYNDLDNKPDIPSIEIVETLPESGEENTIYLQSKRTETTLNGSELVQCNKDQTIFPPSEDAPDSWNGFDYGDSGKYTYAIKVVKGGTYYIETREYEISNSMVYISDSPWSGQVVSWIEVDSDGKFISDHNGYATFNTNSSSTPIVMTSFRTKFYTSSIYNGDEFYSVNPALAAYPIGSIYMSVNDISPALLFGGVWEQLQGNLFLSMGDASNGTTLATYIWKRIA